MARPTDGGQARRGRGPAPVYLHGTEARARRHRRAGEKPCPACLAAETLAGALRREARTRTGATA